MSSANEFPAIVYYRKNEPVNPSVYDSLHTAADVIGDDVEVYLDARNKDEMEKEKWEQFFQEILNGESEVRENEVVREKETYPLTDDPIKPLVHFLHDRKNDVEKVDSGPVFDPELLENSTNKVTVAGSSIVQDPDADHYIGNFQDSNPELSKEVEEGMSYWGIVDEIDEEMTEYLINNADPSNSVILRMSPNHVAYKLDREGFSPKEANLQGPEERTYQGLKRSEFGALTLHETPGGESPKYTGSD